MVAVVPLVGAGWAPPVPGRRCRRAASSPAGGSWSAWSWSAWWWCPERSWCPGRCRSSSPVVAAAWPVAVPAAASAGQRLEQRVALHPLRQAADPARGGRSGSARRRSSRPPASGSASTARPPPTSRARRSGVAEDDQQAVAQHDRQAALGAGDRRAHALAQRPGRGGQQRDRCSARASRSGSPAGAAETGIAGARPRRGRRASSVAVGGDGDAAAVDDQRGHGRRSTTSMLSLCGKSRRTSTRDDRGRARRRCAARPRRTCRVVMSIAASSERDAHVGGVAAAQPDDLTCGPPRARSRATTASRTSSSRRAAPAIASSGPRSAARSRARPRRRSRGARPGRRGAPRSRAPPRPGSARRGRPAWRAALTSPPAQPSGQRPAPRVCTSGSSDDAEALVHAAAALGHQRDDVRGASPRPCSRRSSRASPRSAPRRPRGRGSPASSSSGRRVRPSARGSSGFLKVEPKVLMPDGWAAWRSRAHLGERRLHVARWRRARARRRRARRSRRAAGSSGGRRSRARPARAARRPRR